MVQCVNTPLHFAAINGDETVIKALVAAKADVHAKNNVRGGFWEGEGGGGVRSAFYNVCLEFWA